MNTVQYLGHSSFKIQLGNIVVLIDPAVADTVQGSPRKIAPPLSPHAVRECALIFLTPEQPDHC